jgi:ubiquinone/menaquinone biosynthesis C-methylase UbiE
MEFSTVPVKPVPWLVLAGLGVCLLSSCTSNVTAQTNRPVSNPYTGDPAIFERPDRDKKLQIDRVMDELKIFPGKTVADIGAGGGWFTVRAAKRVGPEGTVYAVEINRQFLKYILERSQKEGVKNVRPVLGTAGDPKLPIGELDAVLLLKTYHEVAEPQTLLANTRKALKPDGLLGVIDRNGRGDDHGLDQKAVVREFEQAGFSLVKSFDFVKGDGEDYFLVFSPKGKS